MSEYTGVDYTILLPPELLCAIFMYLPAKEIMKSRRVCRRWQFLIEDLTVENFWTNACDIEFKDCIYKARRNAKSGMSNFSLYKSLSLWSNLDLAAVETNEFANAFNITDTVFNLVVLQGEILGVHSKSAIDYYDIKTLNMTERRPIRGDFNYYNENEYAIIIVSHFHHLHVVLKRKLCLQRTFDFIKVCILIDKMLYFVDIADEIHECDLTQKCEVISDNLGTVPKDDKIMCIGYSNGCVNVLTYQRKIYTVVKPNTVVLKQTVNSGSNILHLLYKYNFMSTMNWKAYYEWTCKLNPTKSLGPLSNIVIIRPYGDIFLVGTLYGQLFIFYKPFVDGELDIFNVQPIKRFDLLDMSEFMAYNCPIMEIDVMEVDDGHIVFVAMVSRISVLKFTYNFMCLEPVA